MNDSGETEERTETPRRKAARGRLLALLMALLLAATAMVAFSAGSASAQTQNDGSDTSQQLADGTDADDADDADGTCDRDGTRRGGKLGRFGMGDTLTGLLGIDAETLRSKLKDGSTLADIAAAQDVEVADVVDALVTAISEKAAEHDREIDTDELTAKITALVNGERPDGADDAEGKRGRRGLQRGGSDGLRYLGGHASSGSTA